MKSIDKVSLKSGQQVQLHKRNKQDCIVNDPNINVDQETIFLLYWLYSLFSLWAYWECASSILIEQKIADSITSMFKTAYGSMIFMINWLKKTLGLTCDDGQTIIGLFLLDRDSVYDRKRLLSVIVKLHCIHIAKDINFLSERLRMHSSCHLQSLLLLLCVHVYTS